MSSPDTRVVDRWASPEMRAQLARRHAAERRFRLWGLSAIAAALAMLALLLVSITANGLSAFRQAQIQLDVTFAREHLGALEAVGQQEAERLIHGVDFGALLREALRSEFPEVEGRRELRSLQALVSNGARTALREMVLEDRTVIGKTRPLWLPADDEVDAWMKGQIDARAAESDRRLKDDQIAWLETLEERGRLRTSFNTAFFRNGDSREPELAGIRGAVIGSALTLLVTLLFAFPLGVAAAVYLEEFAPRGRWTDLIEVNINNLAAVPSIVFGLLGLAVFLNVLHLPRSAPLVGGLTLALMTLPTIIIAGRASIKAVPPSIREAAQGVGASPLQVVLHHVLPLAMPGILTGTIIGMARALGETAPLLMIGMVAFVVDIPGGFTDASTALPVQIYLWADSPERGFVEKTSGAILLLLGFLIAMNATAIGLRQKFEQRW
jgi:phosphate transport system permease protein